MENNIDNIIYIVISIIVVAISALKKRKKKPGGMPSSERQSGGAGIFDFIEASLQTNSPDYTEENQPISEVVKNETETSYENQKSTQHLIQTEEKRTIVDTPEKLELQNNEEEDDDNDAFDLKEAVIYSEILNRKTF